MLTAALYTNSKLMETQWGNSANSELISLIPLSYFSLFSNNYSQEGGLGRFSKE